jgi:hypothetical protein
MPVCTSICLTGSSHYLAMEMRSTRKNCGDSRWLFLESNARPIRYEDPCYRSTKTVGVASHNITGTFDLPSVVVLLVGKAAASLTKQSSKVMVNPGQFFCLLFHVSISFDQMTFAPYYRKYNHHDISGLSFVCPCCFQESFCVILTDFLCIPSLLVWTSGYNKQQRKLKLIVFIISKMCQDLVLGISRDCSWDMISIKDWPFDDWRSSKSYIKFIL